MKRHSAALVVLMLIASIGGPAPAAAQGTEPFLGQVGIFAFSFCPKGWLPLNGQLLPINRNQALYALLGTTYGGDGKTTFALPTAKPMVTADNHTTMLQCIAEVGVFPSRN